MARTETRIALHALALALVVGCAGPAAPENVALPDGPGVELTTAVNPAYTNVTIAGPPLLDEGQLGPREHVVYHVVKRNSSAVSILLRLQDHGNLQETTGCLAVKGSFFDEALVPIAVHDSWFWLRTFRVAEPPAYNADTYAVAGEIFVGLGANLSGAINLGGLRADSPGANGIASQRDILLLGAIGFPQNAEAFSLALTWCEDDRADVRMATPTYLEEQFRSRNVARQGALLDIDDGGGLSYDVRDAGWGLAHLPVGTVMATVVSGLPGATEPYAERVDVTMHVSDAAWTEAFGTYSTMAASGQVAVSIDFDNVAREWSNAFIGGRTGAQVGSFADANPNPLFFLSGPDLGSGTATISISSAANTSGGRTLFVLTSSITPHYHGMVAPAYERPLGTP